MTQTALTAHFTRTPKATAANATTPNSPSAIDTPQRDKRPQQNNPSPTSETEKMTKKGKQLKTPSKTPKGRGKKKAVAVAFDEDYVDVPLETENQPLGTAKYMTEMATTSTNANAPTASTASPSNSPATKPSGQSTPATTANKPTTPERSSDDAGDSTSVNTQQSNFSARLLARAKTTNTVPIENLRQQTLPTPTTTPGNTPTANPQGFKNVLPRREQRVAKSISSRSLNEHIIRLDIRVPMIPSKTNKEAFVIFRESLLEILEFISEDADNYNLALVPWRNTHLPRFNDVLFDSIPDKRSALSPYVRIINPRPKGQPVYTSIWIAHTQEWDSLADHIEENKGSSDFGIWKSILQVEKVAEIGWLLWSNKAMDVEWWSQFLSQKTGTDIGLRWRSISRAKDKDGFGVPALHVYCDNSKLKQAKEELSLIYGSKMRVFPFNTRLRIIPTYLTDRSRETLEMTAKMVGRQRIFNREAAHFDLPQVRDLDTEDEVTKLSLREMLMGSCVKGRENQPLLHSIDRDYFNDRLVVTVLPQFAKEARLFLRGVAFHTITQFGQSAEQFFTEEALDEASRQSIDERTGALKYENTSEIFAIAAAESDAAFCYLENTQADNAITFDGFKLGEETKLPNAKHNDDEATVFTFTTSIRKAAAAARMEHITATTNDAHAPQTATADTIIDYTSDASEASRQL